VPRAELRWKLLRWHRRTGLVVALLAVWLAATGVLIGHADALGLPQRHLQAPWLLRWYGLPAPQLQAAFELPGPQAVAGGSAASSRWLSQWGDAAWLDWQRLELPPLQALLGAFPLEVQGAPLLLLVDRRQALVLTPQGQRVDQLSWQGPAQRAGVRRAAAARAVYLQTEDGRLWRSDAQMSGFEPLSAEAAAPLWEEIAWARPSALPADLGRALAQAQQPTGPSAERLLLDLHSGRFLGPLGPWLMDAAALGLLLLAATGLWTVLQRPRRGSTR
jgi:hypothetical protein